MQMIPFSFRSIEELELGPKWAAVFEERWPHYREWFLREGEDARPSYATSVTGPSFWPSSSAARACSFRGSTPTTGVSSVTAQAAKVQAGQPPLPLGIGKHTLDAPAQPHRPLE